MSELSKQEKKRLANIKYREKKRLEMEKLDKESEKTDKDDEKFDVISQVSDNPSQYHFSPQEIEEYVQARIAEERLKISEGLYENKNIVTDVKILPAAEKDTKNNTSNFFFRFAEATMWLALPKLSVLAIETLLSNRVGTKSTVNSEKPITTESSFQFYNPFAPSSEK